MQIVLGDNLHEVSNPAFYMYFEMSSLNEFTKHGKR